MAQLTIVRGVPGSGKSTYCRKVIDVCPLEADSFFYAPNLLDRKYKWSKELLEYAHKQCLSDSAYELYHGDDVVVANTFTKVWEIKKYLDMVQAVGTVDKVTIIHVNGNFKNIHDVPEEKVEQMRQRFVSNDVVEQAVKHLYDFEIEFKEVVPNGRNDNT